MAYGFKPFRRFPKEMHKVKCSECGKMAEVPFKPSGDRPVYCKECFLKRRGITPREPEKTEETETKAKKVKEEKIEEEEPEEEIKED
jgi:CxxC-x17-CxxC domain-containing protein